MERSESGAAFRRHAAELDVGRHMHVVTLRAAATMVAAASVVALLFSSQTLVDWTFELPLWIGPARDSLHEAALAWHAAMTALGFDRVSAGLHEAFVTVKGWAETPMLSN